MTLLGTCGGEEAHVFFLLHMDDDMLFEVFLSAWDRA